MREIKFIGNCIYPGKIVYGTGVFHDGCNTWLNYLEKEQALAFGMVKQIVDPKTIRQLTGIDKDGGEIYETL